MLKRTASSAAIAGALLLGLSGRTRVWANAPAPGAAAATDIQTDRLTANWTANGNLPEALYTAQASLTSDFAAITVSSQTAATSALLDGLSANTSYFIRVQATDGTGPSDFTSLGFVTTLANPPGSAAPTDIGTNALTANWTPSGNPPGTLYHAQISADAGFTTIAAEATTTASSATLMGLSANTAYFLRVQALNQNGLATTFTTLPGATTLENSPNAPGASGFTNIAATQLKANWTTSGNDASVSYTAILSSAASPGTNGLADNLSITNSTTSALFAGLTPNTLYFVDVKATSTGGSSAFSSLGSAVTLANAPVSAAPTGIQANQITAQWTANGNPSGTFYMAEASLDAGFASITTSVSTTSLFAVLTGLAPGTPYFMRVQARNQTNQATDFTSLPPATTLGNPPNAPASAGFSGILALQLSANWLANGNPPGTSYTALLSTAPSPSTNGLANISVVTNQLSAPFPGLSPNTLYYAQVKASNAAGDSPFTDLGSAPTLADLPTPSAPTEIQTNQVTANWGTHGNPPGTLYLAQASPDAGFTTITSAKSTSASSVTLTGLLPDTTYFMRVQASNQIGTPTAFVTLPQAATLTNPPNAPVAAGFSGITAAQLAANWTANGNPAGTLYTAVISTAAQPGTNNLPGNQSLTTTNVTAPFTGLLPNTLYFAQVKASRAGGDSAFTDLGSVPTLANVPTPANPTNVQINQLTANWGFNGNPPGTLYLVQASPDAGFASITSAVSTTNSSATLTGLLANTPYFLRVQASNQTGTPTVFIPLPQATTLTNPPNAPDPAGFSGAGTNQLQANWSANGNPAGTLYNAVLSTAPGAGTNALPGNKTITTTNLAAPFTALSPNTLYYVDVNAASSGGSSAFTALGSLATLANAPTPGTPSNIQTNQITAAWDSNGNPAGTSYLVQASPDSGFGTITSAVSTTNSSATLTGLSANTNYFMRVRASNQASVPSAFVPLPQATTLSTPPGVPGAAGFSGVSITELTANWSANGNPAGTLYNAILSTAPAPSANNLAGNRVINTTNLSAPFTSLSPNTRYYVDVNASSTGGNSEYTALGSVPTLANPPTPAASSDVQTNQLTAHWEPNNNPAGTVYLVQASPDAAFGTVTSAVTTASSSATLTGLSANTKYFMRVQAFNQSGIPTAFVSLPAASTLNTPPNVPIAAGFSGLGTAQVSANWTANGNPLGTSYTAILSTAPAPDTNNLPGNLQIVTTNHQAPFATLAPNTLYYARVKALNGGGSSAFADLGSIATLANVPAPSALIEVGTNQIGAGWDANGNPAGTSYLAQASPDAAFSAITSAVTTTNSSATLRGLSANTHYFLRVRAFNQASVPTAAVLLPEATTLTTPPNVPVASGFSGVTAAELEANWGSNGNAAGTLYNAVLSTAPNAGTNALPDNKLISTTNLKAPFTGLLPNTLYYVDVNASNAGGSSAYATLGSVSTLANPPVPGAPSAIQTNQLTANWAANGNPTGTSYLVQASPDAGFATITSAVTTTNSSATLTGLLANTSYFMRVRAANQASLATAFVPLPPATTLSVPPNTPIGAGLSAVTATQVQANWSANGNVAGTLYNAVLSTAAAPGTNTLPGNKLITTTNLFAPFTGLSPNTLYFVEVNAANAGGASAYAALGSVSTLANPPLPDNPSGLGANHVTVHWQANGNPDGTTYVAQASLDAGFTTITSIRNVATTSAVFDSLSPNTPYFFRVQAVNQGFISTPFVILPSTTTLANAPALPIPLPFTNATTTQVQAHWSGNGNPAGTLFTVTLSLEPSPSSNGLPGNLTSPTTSTSTVFTGLTPNTLYFADVKASNATGESASASLGSVATLANAPGAANPTAIANNQVTANWTPNGNPDGTLYLVQAGLSADFSSLIAAQVTAFATYTFTGLQPNTTYYMRVQAINQTGVATPFTTLAPATTVIDAPGGIVLTAAQMTDTSITWTWNSVPNANAYYLIDETDAQVSPSFDSSARQWLEAGRAVNTLYNRRLVAFNAGGSSTSTLVSVYTLAHQPTGLATSVVASTAITITWNANGNPLNTQYTAQITQTIGSARTQTGTGTEMTFSGLTGASTYFITLRALNGAGVPASGDNALTVATLPQLFASGQICPQTPGVLAFTIAENAQVLVEVPAGAFGSCINLGAQVLRDFPNAPSSGTPLEGTGVGGKLCDLASDPACNLVNSPSVQAARALLLTIPIGNVPADKRAQTVLARYDETHKMWVMVPSTVDSSKNTITARADRLAIYQVMVALPSTELGNIRIYPNPFRPAQGHSGVQFVNLPVDSTIDLFTLIGEKVQNLAASPAGTAFWDGRNKAGQDVASGVYFAVIKSGGAKTILKVAVQR